VANGMVAAFDIWWLDIGLEQFDYGIYSSDTTMEIFFPVYCSTESGVARCNIVTRIWISRLAETTPNSPVFCIGSYYMGQGKANLAPVITSVPEGGGNIGIEFQIASYGDSTDVLNNCGLRVLCFLGP
jgi:hypothetical protein